MKRQKDDDEEIIERGTTREIDKNAEVKIGSKKKQTEEKQTDKEPADSKNKRKKKKINAQV